MNQQLTLEEEQKILPDGEFFLDQFGDCFARFSINLHLETHPVRSSEYRRVLTLRLAERGYKPSADRINELVGLSEAEAIRSGKVYPLYNRIAWYDDCIWLDLCGPLWEVVRISKRGWEITSPPIPLFRRYTHMKRLDLDVKTGAKSSLEEFLRLLKIHGDDRILAECYIAASLIPGIPHPILIFAGAQGAAKSTKMKAIRRIVDNSEVLLLSLPRDHAQFVQQLQHHYMPFYDNCDELYAWQSDSFCRASTGEGFSKRALYTDDSDRIYKFQRCCGLNGINVPATRPDMLDRTLLISVERLEDSERITEKEVELLLAQVNGKTLHYLLDCVVLGLQLYDSVESALKGRYLRMADFTVWGETFARIMGHEPLAFYNAYLANVRRQNIEAISGSIIGQLLTEFVQADLEIKATSLYEGLKTLALGKGLDLKSNRFPANPSVMSRRINSLKPNLAELGIKFTLTHGREGNVYLFSFRQMPSHDSHASPLTAKITDVSEGSEGSEGISQKAFKAPDRQEEEEEL